jgi:anti-sigma B factor antagonist
LLAIDMDDRGRTAVLRARGEIDMLTVTHLRSALDCLLRSGAGTVVVDLRDVSFVDCTGIGLLADARRRARRAGIRLRIVAGRAVARTAAVLDLTAALGVHERA